MLQIRSAGPGGARETANGVEFFPGFPRRATSFQGIVGSSTVSMAGDNPIDAGGFLIRARFVTVSPAAAGESQQIDVTRLRAGSPTISILAAPFTFGGPGGQGPGSFDLPLAPGIELAPGDGLEVSRSYVPGGGPTMGNNGVFVDFAGDIQPE